MLNYENHMEVRLVKDKEPPPPSNNAGKTIVTITSISIAANLALKVMFPDITLSPAIAVDAPTRPAEEISIERYDNPPPHQDRTFPPESSVVGRNFFQIVECGTVYPAAANFRAYPGLASHGIRGVVPHGEWVMLTGLRHHADGVLWHQVVNQSMLWRSFEPGAFNQLDANQLGWVAGCFI